MRPPSEGEVAVRVTGEVEAVWLRELSRVAVSGPERGYDLLAFAYLSAPDLDLPGGHVEGGALHRALKTQRLLYGGTGELRLAPEPL